MFLSRFFKLNQAQASAKSNNEKKTNPDKIEYYYRDYDWAPVQNNIDAVASLLDIEVPPIHVVPYMIDDGMHHFLSEAKLSGDIGYNTGYFDPNTNDILIGLYNPQKEQLHTEAEMLFSLFHEIRHVWQKRHHEDIYYAENAVGYETIYDVA